MMAALIAACVAFIPAAPFGWITSSWLPALTAGAMWFLLLWPLSALIKWGVSQLISLASNPPIPHTF